LPVDQLMTRLARLEEKLAAQETSESRPQPPTPDTLRAPRLHSDPVATPKGVFSGSTEQAWRDFVAAVRREKKFLASHLDQAQVLELRPGRLAIGVKERHELSFLQDSENAAALKNLARSFFDTDTVVELKLTAEAAAGEQRGTGGVAPAPVERSPIVTEAVRILGGTVRSVRREGGEG
jgi:hypothetical protein